MIIGIDPGKKGGVAVMFDKGGQETFEMPSNYDFHDLMQTLRDRSEMNVEPIKVYIEQVYAMSKQQKQTEYVEHSGALKQSLRVLNIPFVTIHPTVWKKKLKLTKDKKASLVLVRDLFGSFADSIGKHDGMAEALLIAYYGKNYIA